MTKKSAASVKPIPFNKAPELPPLEETFDNAKQAFINTLETSIIIAKRVDNLLNIRDYLIGYWKSTNKLDSMMPMDRMAYFKEMQLKTVMVYEQLLEATKTFELEEFCKEEMKDYYEDIIPSIEEIDSEQDLCTAGLIFLTVKPFGEKMTALHHTILDEKKQREFMEAGNE